MLEYHSIWILKQKDAVKRVQAKSLLETKNVLVLWADEFKTAIPSSNREWLAVYPNIVDLRLVTPNCAARVAEILKTQQDWIVLCNDDKDSICIMGQNGLKVPEPTYSYFE